MATRQQHAPAGSGAPASSRAARGPTWRALLEAQWRARLEEVTELSLAYHDAAAITAPASAGRTADRNLRQLLRRAVAARRALADTDDALARLASGRYGICEGCAAAVPAWLLVVAPEARYCLRCRPKALGRSEVASNLLRINYLLLTLCYIKTQPAGPSRPPGGGRCAGGGSAHSSTPRTSYQGVHMPVHRLARLPAVAAAGCLAAAVIATAPSAIATASQRAPARASFVPYSAFLRSAAQAQYGSYPGTGRPGAVRSAQAFQQMRSYVLSTYRGVKVKHSFVSGGKYFDCVTMRSQPTVRDLHLATIATPPAAAPAHSTAGQAARSLLTMGLHDAYGNAISCPAGSIPMLRLSLRTMSGFPSLHAFLAKGPDGTARVPKVTANAHRYAYGYQSITNYGGNSWLNVWNPSGPFTLSQQWYVNGSGSGTQTVEGGWVHYPAKFGTKSVLFIFSTPNDYASGCYNLECSGFVQTSSSVTLGGPFTNYSHYGKTQYGFALQWKYYNGNWWMYYQGNAVGYYPGSVFNGGPMATNSNLNEFGGETYTSGTVWPQMGSGKFPKAGFKQAAYQNTIFYIPRNESGGTGVWSSLTPVQTNPACYKIKYTPSSKGGSWGTYFYYGGPGGTC